jgi:hypothetical protein
LLDKLIYLPLVCLGTAIYTTHSFGYQWENIGISNLIFARLVKIRLNISAKVSRMVFPQNDKHFITKMLFSKLNKHHQNNYSKIVSSKNYIKFTQ